MAIKLLVNKHALSDVSAEVLSSIKDKLVTAKVVPPDVEIEPDPIGEALSSKTVTYGFPGNILEGIGGAVGISKCSLVGQLAYTACMSASGANAIICAGVGAAAEKACEG